jgi:hypothetical protein
MRKGYWGGDDKVTDREPTTDDATGDWQLTVTTTHEMIDLFHGSEVFV